MPAAVMHQALAASFAGVSPTFEGITFKGRGTQASTTSYTIGYDTVTEGSAPAAGDLVVWNIIWFGFDGINPSLPASWARSYASVPDSFSRYGQAIIAKVVTAADIASPASLGSSFSGACGMWAAFSVTGTIASLSIGGGHAFNWGAASAPSNVSLDSSALNSPAVAITCVAATGDDGSITLAGITPTKSESFANFYSTIDSVLGFKTDVGGAAYTLSKSDDGNGNALAGGYVAIG